MCPMIGHVQQSMYCRSFLLQSICHHSDHCFVQCWQLLGDLQHLCQNPWRHQWLDRYGASLRYSPPCLFQPKTMTNVNIRTCHEGFLTHLCTCQGTCLCSLSVHLSVHLSLHIYLHLSPWASVLVSVSVLVLHAYLTKARGLRHHARQCAFITLLCRFGLHCTFDPFRVTIFSSS